MPKLRIFAILLSTMLIASCTQNFTPVAEACKAEVMRKSEGQNVTVDIPAMTKSVSKLPDGTYEIKESAVINAGTSQESSLAFSCLSQVDGANVTVIRVEFTY